MKLINRKKSKKSVYRYKKYETTLEAFCIQSLEKVMILERENYLNKNKSKKDKGNGFYSRCFTSCEKKRYKLYIPRTRTGHFIPLCLILLRYNQEKMQQLLLNLYKEPIDLVMIKGLLKNYFGEKLSKTELIELTEIFQYARIDWGKKVSRYLKKTTSNSPKVINESSLAT